MKNIVTLFLLISLFACNTSKKDEPFWPPEKAPELIGQKAIADFFSRDDYWLVTTDEYQSIHYSEACTGFGAARFANLTGNDQIIEKLTERYMKVIEDSIPITGNHVDGNVYGILPLELYKHTGIETFKEQGMWLADQQWENPTPEGLSYQTRFWIDDIWMIGSLQTQAYRVTGNPVYIERAATEIAAYLDKLQQTNGLFHHGPGFPFFWGRGNGWVAAGLAEVISELPPENEHYAKILDGYKKMMDALVKYQATNGMWRQLIDKDFAWEETSCTAMFGYALRMGVKSGRLKNKKYREAYQKAWLALTDYLNEEGKLTEVCIGTGQQNDINFYLERPRITGDFHGQAPLIWFAGSLLNNDQEI
ncbi:MAG: glycoside hydrolase family 88 protein [Prolixibacteraceae bacterium]|nr:glycoside hydrolase family 88 protein [Prolixibacteraceae bacterium]